VGTRGDPITVASWLEVTRERKKIRLARFRMCWNLEAVFFHHTWPVEIHPARREVKRETTVPTCRPKPTAFVGAVHYCGGGERKRKGEGIPLESCILRGVSPASVRLTDLSLRKKTKKTRKPGLGPLGEIRSVIRTKWKERGTGFILFVAVT